MSEELPAADSPIRGEDVVVDVQLSWQEAKHGCARMVRVDDRMEKVDLPSGVKNGQAIWLPGRGMPGLNGGRPGNLSVRLEVEPEPERGVDVEARLEVLPEEAVRGAEKMLQVGEAYVAVTVPPGIQEGQIIRLVGRGAPGQHGGAAGDLVVTVAFASILPVLATESTDLPDRLRATPPSRRRGRSPMLLIGGVGLAAVVAGMLWQVGQTKGQTASAGTGTVPAAQQSQSAAGLAPAKATAEPARTVRVCSASSVRATPDCPQVVEREFTGASAPTETCTRHEKVPVKVCAGSGLPPNEHCPKKVTRKFAGTEVPTGTCTEHRPPAQMAVVVCRASGLRAGENCTNPVRRMFTAAAAPAGFCRAHRERTPRVAPAAPQTRFCGGCGTTVRGSTRFCGSCGRAL